MEIGRIARSMYAAMALGAAAIGAAPMYAIAQNAGMTPLQEKREQAAMKREEDWAAQLKLREWIGRDDSCLKPSIVATYTSKAVGVQNLKFGDIEQERRITAYVETPNGWFQSTFSSDHLGIACPKCPTLDKIAITYARVRKVDGSSVDVPIQARYRDNDGKNAIMNYAANFTCTLVPESKKREFYNVREVHFATMGDIVSAHAAAQLLTEARAMHSGSAERRKDNAEMNAGIAKERLEESKRQREERKIKK